jgi:hypothetical protein
VTVAEALGAEGGAHGCEGQLLREERLGAQRVDRRHQPRRVHRQQLLVGRLLDRQPLANVLTAA